MERPQAVRSCADCTACAVRSGGFAAGLDVVDLQRLDRAKVAHSYRRGQPLFYEGNPSTAVYCIRSALVKVVKTAPHGRRHVLALAGPGDLLGLEACVSGAPYGNGAEILADGLVCQIERSDIAHLVETYPAFQKAAVQHLAEVIRDAQGERAQLAGGDVRERTAHVILHLATRFGEPQDGRVHLMLDLSREDLADMIGVAAETVIRQLSDLRRRGIVTTSGRAIVVEDTERLARLARASNTNGR